MVAADGTGPDGPGSRRGMTTNTRWMIWAAFMTACLLVIYYL